MHILILKKKIKKKNKSKIKFLSKILKYINLINF